MAKARTAASNPHKTALTDAAAHLHGIAGLVDELRVAIDNPDNLSNTRMQLVREALVEKIESQLTYVLDDIIGDTVPVHPLVA